MARGSTVIETDFENPFSYFIRAVRVLSHDAAAQCEEMGNFNTPWEIQHDVIARAEEILASPLSYLTAEQKESIVTLTILLSKLPADAIAAENLSMTTHAGCLAAMKHPAWMPMRERALQLLAMLEWAIKCNEASFND